MNLLIKVRQEEITSGIRTQNPIYFPRVSLQFFCATEEPIPKRLDERIKMEVLTVPNEK